jgi:hypothetical protein
MIPEKGTPLLILRASRVANHGFFAGKHPVLLAIE